MIGQSLSVLQRAFTAVANWFGMSITAVSASGIIIAGITAFAVYRFIISPLVGGRSIGLGSDIAKKREKE